MAAGLQLYSLYLLLLSIDFPDQYKTIHCEYTNENCVCNKWYHTYHNSLENINHFIHRFSKIIYSEGRIGQHDFKQLILLGNKKIILKHYYYLNVYKCEENF